MSEKDDFVEERTKENFFNLVTQIVPKTRSSHLIEEQRETVC